MGKSLSRTILFMAVTTCLYSCVAGHGSDVYMEKASEDILRAIEMTDSALSAYMGPDMQMYKSYNPFTGEVDDRGAENVWEYSSAFEAVAGILTALDLQRGKGDSTLYCMYFHRFREIADSLYAGMQYFKGSYELTSYTKLNHPWTVYGVPRANKQGTNNVTGILNVYDDQMWLMRDFIEVYRATGDSAYLEEAEYLAEYVIDGYDCHVDENGIEYGGITWGPGYLSKHSCSNGPVISPLVWLSDIYRGAGEKALRYCIDPEDRATRFTVEMDRSEYFLYYAEKVYEYQKTHLLREDGVYDDMMGGAEPADIFYEKGNGGFRGHNELLSRIGPAISYNSGTMLSAAADLYRATGKEMYLEDLKKLTDASFSFFAKRDSTLQGLYVYDFSGNNSWFNAVLLRGFADASELYDGADLPVDSFQKVYDYAYGHFIHGGMFPPDLYRGWSEDVEKTCVRGRDQFAYAAQFALLAKYYLEKQ